MSFPVPFNETARLRALRSLQILDTGPERAFDLLTDLACTQFAAPIALVSLVDEGRQWFKSASGLDVSETGRDVAFCAHAILEPDDPSLESSTEFSMQVGAGAFLAVTKNLMLRFDARWLPTFTDTGVAGICGGGCVIAVESDLYHQVQINAGLTLRF